MSYHSPLSRGAQTSDSTEADREGQHNEGDKALAAGSERPSDNKPSSDSFSSTWGDTSSIWKRDTAKTKTSTPLKTDTQTRTKPASRKARSPRPAGSNTPSQTPQLGRTEDRTAQQTNPPSEQQVTSSSLPITSTPVAVSVGDKMAGPSNTTSVSSSSSLPTSPIAAVEDSSSTRHEESVDCGDGKEDEQRTSDVSKRTDESEVNKMEEMLASCIAETDNQTSRETDSQQHGQSEVMVVVSEDDASDNNSPADTVEKDEGEKELASESTTVVVPQEGEEKDVVKVEPPIVTLAPVTSSSSSNEREEQSTLVTEREKETVPADGDRDKATDNMEHIREVQFVLYSQYSC